MAMYEVETALRLLLNKGYLPPVKPPKLRPASAGANRP
jgi:hypothetical protein